MGQDFSNPPTQRHPRPRGWLDCPVLPTQRQPWALRLGPWALGPWSISLNSHYHYFFIILHPEWQELPSFISISVISAKSLFFHGNLKVSDF
jgi:hypothetical protein